jgi:hypothetical protein
MLEGDPGLGKSLVALDLCARLSIGREMPDGSSAGSAASSIVFNGEDGREDTIRPRLEALGADVNRIFIRNRSDRGAEPPFRLPSNCAAVDAALTKNHAKLIVFDPIVQFLDPSITVSIDAHVRQALTPLGDVAENHQCAAFLIRHLSKTGSARSIYRGSGSMAFMSVCRSSWLAARHPDDPATCVLAQVKNNLVPPQPSLTYRVVAQPGAPPTISWLGTSDLTCDQLLARAYGMRKAGPRVRARRLLKWMLERGPLTTREIWERLLDEEISDRTLRRAKGDLEVETRRIYVDKVPRTYWLLPGHQLPDCVRANDFDLGALLGRKKPDAARPTPLDEW